jgi:asparagine synthetase B (glutamine-hydrolysing)
MRRLYSRREEVLVADVAVLLSGGLDSAVLVAHAARTGVVQPIYVTAGLAWEREETALAERLLQSAPFRSGVRPLVRLALDVTDL